MAEEPGVGCRAVRGVGAGLVLPVLGLGMLRLLGEGRAGGHCGNGAGKGLDILFSLGETVASWVCWKMV